jgi:hypothetical protein
LLAGHTLRRTRCPGAARMPEPQGAALCPVPDIRELLAIRGN